MLSHRRQLGCSAYGNKVVSNYLGISQNDFGEFFSRNRKVCMDSLPMGEEFLIGN